MSSSQPLHDTNLNQNKAQLTGRGSPARAVPSAVGSWPPASPPRVSSDAPATPAAWCTATSSRQTPSPTPRPAWKEGRDMGWLARKDDHATERSHVR